jgi:hypothetical protein
VDFRFDGRQQAYSLLVRLAALIALTKRSGVGRAIHARVSGRPRTPILILAQRVAPATRCFVMRLTRLMRARHRRGETRRKWPPRWRGGALHLSRESVSEDPAVSCQLPDHHQPLFQPTPTLGPNPTLTPHPGLAPHPHPGLTPHPGLGPHPGLAPHAGPADHAGRGLQA